MTRSNILQGATSNSSQWASTFIDVTLLEMAIAFCSPIISDRAIFLGVGCTGLLIEGLSNGLQEIDSLVVDEDVTKFVFVVEYPSLRLVAASDDSITIVTNETARIIATNSENHLVSSSATLLVLPTFHLPAIVSPCPVSLLTLSNRLNWLASCLVQNESGFHDSTVFLRSGYFVQSLTLGDAHGLDMRIITVQAVDCDEGDTIGADNQTWCVISIVDSTLSVQWLSNGLLLPAA